jgi:plasmid stabilization system protein ParE
MKFDIEILPEATERIEAQARFIAEEKLEPQSATVWLAEVNDAIASLNFLPSRCSLAPENKFTSETIYMLPIHRHLILFGIDENAAKIKVYSFRAGRERPQQSLGE